MEVWQEDPDLAYRARVQGRVKLLVTVDEEGNVSHADVLEGHPLLDSSAVEAVKQWKYGPILLNGKPIPVTSTVIVSFDPTKRPCTTSGERSNPDVIVVSLDEAGQIAINKEPISIGNLGEGLQKILSKRSNTNLFVSIPDKVNYSDVTEIIKIAKEAGADKIVLITTGRAKTSSGTESVPD